MSFYLVDHGNIFAARWHAARGRTLNFWGYDSRPCPIRGIVIHTAENLPDYVPPDAGAEAVAHYLWTVNRPASAHVVFDTDSTVPLLPDTYCAFHAAGANSAALGVEFATKAARWGSHPEWEEALLRQAAPWLRARCRLYGIPCRRITATEWKNGASGFIFHSDLDPTRRKDPGKRFPLERLFQLIGEDDMNWIELLQEMPRDWWRDLQSTSGTPGGDWTYWAPGGGPSGSASQAEWEAQVGNIVAAWMRVSLSAGVVSSHRHEQIGWTGPAS